MSCRPCQWYSAYFGSSPVPKAVSGAYQMSPPWSRVAPPDQKRGHAPNVATTTAAAASQATRSQPRVRAAASMSTASPGTTHTQ
jgi:hypothetical protein